MYSTAWLAHRVWWSLHYKTVGDASCLGKINLRVLYIACEIARNSNPLENSVDPVLIGTVRL